MKHLRLFLLVFLTAFAGLSQAASVSFGLNENNIDLDNTIDYATVTISDSIVAGAIDFVIDVNNDFFGEGNNFGIQSFFFNSALSIGPANVIATSNTNWAFLTDFGDGPNDGFNASQFGRFDITYRGTGNMREDPLAFTIRADGDEDLMTYALNNTSGFAFAAHIAGFNNVEGADSGWFASDLSPVPVPASFWLFGTALIGFIGISRRTRV